MQGHLPEGLATVFVGALLSLTQTISPRIIAIYRIEARGLYCPH
jgi:hypothetical protein